MTKEVIFAGLLGLGIGGGIGSFVAHALTKRKYSDILKTTVDNYEKLLSEAQASNCDDDVPDEFKRYIPEEKHEEPSKMSDEDKAMIKEKLRYNHEKTTSYAAMYHTSTPIRDIIDAQAEEESKRDEEILKLAEASDDKSLDIEETEEKAINIFDAASKNSNKMPRIISEEDYNDICDNHSDTWESNNLFLYNDDTITTEDDKVIDPDELSSTLGDCLDKYDFRNSKEKHLYIQNFKLSTVYEIVKINKPFIG